MRLRHMKKQMMIVATMLLATFQVNAQKEVLFLPTLPTFTFNSLTTNALGYVGNYVGM